MRQILTTLGLLVLMLGCQKDAGIGPGEVEATITGYVIADYWSKGCSAGGLEIQLDKASYIISNSLSPDYEQANAWPISVWVRYKSAPPDSCAQWTNRVTIRSIRKR